MKPRDCVSQRPKCLKIRHFLYRPNHGGALGRHLFEYIIGFPFLTTARPPYLASAIRLVLIRDIREKKIFYQL